MGFDNIPKYDIIAPIDIPINPFLYALILLLFILGAVMIWVWRRWRGRRDVLVDTRILRYQKLAGLNLDDTKNAAYAISNLGYEFALEELAYVYESLNNRLEPYKYAKNVKPFDHDTVEAYRQFCERVYEKIS